MFDHEEDTPETLFGSATEPGAAAPATVVVAAENGSPAKRVGRKPIGDGPMSGRERKARSDAKTRDAKNVKAYVYNSPQEPTKNEALEILKGRGLKHQHVIATVYNLLIEAAQANDIAPNRFLFQNGVQQALASYDAKEAKPLDSVPCEPVVGELLDRASLYALWDASISWRENLAFDEFLPIRHNCKTDCFYLGKEILEKDFAQLHREWSDFFPKFDPDTLPPEYNQRAAIKWLASQTDTTKNFLLMASRSSFKSSWSHIWLLTLILCLPDIRILLVSETRPLAKDFLGVIRSYFERVPGQESRFLHLFPEFAISEDDGTKLTLEVPMRRLKLPQSIESTSMESSSTGRRADVILFDDPISITSCGNDVQIAASVRKFDSICKLREAGAGIVGMLGTPWASKDLYSQVIERNDKDPNKPWAIRIDPAWTRKPHAVATKLRDLEEDDVVLAFPEKLTWKFLQSELRQNEAFFQSQNLIEWPTEEDADTKVTFTEDDLRSHTKHPDFFAQMPMIETVMSVDQAFSKSRFADFSCIATIQLRKNKGRTIAVVTDVILDRLKQSELADVIVEACIKHRPTRVVVEKDGPWEALMQAIKRAALLRGFVLPYFIWRESNPGNKQDAKAKRIKGLEPMIPSGELWFYSSYEWNEAVIAQFVKFDGITKSNSSRKDDAPDAVAIGIEQFFPKTIGDEDEEDIKTQEERERQQKAAQDAADLRKYYEHMHGTSPLDTSTRASQWSPRQEQAPVPTPEQSQQRKRTVVGGRFAALPWQGRRT
jgi:hypothetical protein